MFTGCSNIFVDVGSNRGTHVRKLFEPSKYPLAPYLKVFDAAFGTAATRTGPSNETGICAFGFEANPRWAPTLLEVEKAYQRAGWRVKLFSPLAVSDTNNSTVELWMNDDSGANSDWGASFTKTQPAATPISVNTSDLSAFVERMHQHSGTGGYRLMKMDIEGAEFKVLPRFLQKQLFCKNVLDKITIEWHLWILPEEEKAPQAKLIDSWTNGATCSSGPKTELVDLDNESYLEDGMPLPE